ncbi:MAG TPA: PepSY domain-containing protein [Candidatus Baltobacteraceae bacterium]|jgi:uncharacterized membrane protein YkoI|nr:PepSY domain-containing protein [Candidatus Baltobacteraceae bacterium]
MQLRTIAASAATAALVILTLGGALAAPASPYQKDAKITMAQARAIALRAMPGATIADAELEKERGGSGLRYSFDVKYKGKTYEIGIDAKTGKILEKAAEGANPD